MSFAFWFKGSNEGQWARIFDFGNGAGINNVIVTFDYGYLSASILSTYYTNAWGVQAVDNTWRHAVWTIDATGIWTFYLNGAEVASGKRGYPDYVARQFNYLGRSGWDTNPYFSGAIDEFYVFDYTITPAQVLELFSQSTPAPTPVPTLAPTPAPSSLSTSALIYYSFDADTVSGTTVANLGNGGSEYDAQLKNSASISISSNNYVVGTGGATFSAASSDHIQINSQSLAFGVYGMSFAFWFKGSNEGQWARIFDFGNGPGINNVYVTLDYGHLTASISWTYYTNGWGAQVEDNTWRHAVWTIDATGIWTFYLNGAEVTSAKMGYPDYVARQFNYLGRSGFNGDPYFNGAIDEFYVFDYAITPAQVLALYNE
eukprot:gene4364-biopygen4698